MALSRSTSSPTTRPLLLTLAAHINAVFQQVIEDNHGEEAFEVQPQERLFELSEYPHLSEQSLYLHLILREHCDHISVYENVSPWGKCGD